MKYGILGDVHGNLEALTAVLEEMYRQGVKKFVSAGDVVGYGANPGECLAKLRDLGTIIAAGNHDRAVCGLLGIEFFNTFARQSCEWTQGTLTAEDKGFLKSLKLVEHVDNFSVAHASLYCPENFDYIQTTYDANLCFERQKTKIAFTGHSHIPIVFYRRKRIIFEQSAEIRINTADKLLINVGAIGQPRDENPESVCAVYDSGEGIVRLKRIPYDVDKAAQKIKNAGLPDILAERLRYGR
jgi:predicted phosphodiesterase